MKRISWAPPLITKNEKNSVAKVFDSNWLAQGPITNLLEQKICETVNSKYAVVVNNGTSALICALLSHEIGQGDEVLVPSYTFVASVNAILSVGAKPILVDCDPNTFNTTVELIEKKITKKTKAILPVDVCGMPIDIDSFRNFSKNRNIILIEDSAESLGAKYKNKPVGSFGHTTTFSFHMAKVVAGIEGGCLVTNDKKIASKAKHIRSHGSIQPYDSKYFGLNLRISDVHSAVILSQLKKINQFLTHRNTISKLYKDELQNYKFQEIPNYVTLHPYMLFSMLIPQKYRNKLNNFLNKNGIETRICWPPVHMQKFHSKLFNVNLPNSEKLYSTMLNLPMGNGLSIDDVYHVIKIIKKWEKQI